jgi:diguanylate cyclase (GGDEF)-like protein
MVGRYNFARNETIRMQKTLIKEKVTNSEYLENEVQNRTSDLEISNLLLREKTTHLEKAKEELQIAATTDALTNLHNRRYFIEVSQSAFFRAMRYSHAMCIIMIDIDFFKKVNDTYGHTMGDTVLKACADVFVQSVRKSDIVARYGGEEFIIIIEQSKFEQVIELAERIRQDIELMTFNTENGKEIRVSISLGVSELRHKSDEKVDSIVVRADEALYQAKEDGRNQVKY